MSKYKWGELSQYAEWLDGPVAWGGRCSLCLGPALGKQASLCPDSHCLRTVCRGTGQARAATLPRPQNSLRHATAAATPQGELVKEQVKKLSKQAGGRAKEVVRQLEQLALPGQGPEELEGGPGTPSGQLPTQGLASRLDLQEPVLVLALVLTYREISGSCHLWASVSSPVNQGTLGQSVVFKLKKKKVSGILSSNKILPRSQFTGMKQWRWWLKEVWRCRMLPTPQPRAHGENHKAPWSLRLVLQCGEVEGSVATGGI